MNKSAERLKVILIVITCVLSLAVIITFFVLVGGATGLAFGILIGGAIAIVLQYLLLDALCQALIDIAATRANTELIRLASSEAGILSNRYTKRLRKLLADNRISQLGYNYHYGSLERLHHLYATSKLSEDDYATKAEELLQALESAV